MIQIRVSTTIITLSDEFVPEQIFNYETQSRMEKIQESNESIINYGDKFPIGQPIILRIRKKHIDYDTAYAFINLMDSYTPNLNRFYYYGRYTTVQKAYWVWNFGADKTIIEGRLIMVPTNSDSWI